MDGTGRMNGAPTRQQKWSCTHGPVPNSADNAYKCS